MNLYTYCHNNPVLNFDPSGHIKCPKWLKDTWDFVKGTAEEIPHYALDLTMGLANSVDEKLAFGTGNKIRENFGIDAYEPYDQSYYNGTYLAGEAFSTIANAYMLADGISALTNAKNIFKGGMSVAKVTAGGKAFAGGYSVVVDGSAAIRTINGVIFSGWSAGNIMYSKGKPGGKNTSKNIRKVDDNYLEQKGFNAHELKKDALGSKANISQYDIYQDANGDLWVYRKGGKGEGIPLYENIK